MGDPLSRRPPAKPGVRRCESTVRTRLALQRARQTNTEPPADRPPPPRPGNHAAASTHLPGLATLFASGGRRATGARLNEKQRPQSKLADNGGRWAAAATTCSEAHACCSCN
eukprot:2693622-Alexandrium_andersonii.AAC.1